MNIGTQSVHARSHDICHKTEFIDGTVSYSEAFDPDDPTLMDRYPRYDMDKHLGDRPLTPRLRYNNEWFAIN